MTPVTVAKPSRCWHSRNSSTSATSAAEERSVSWLAMVAAMNEIPVEALDRRLGLDVFRRSRMAGEP
jgi:hypothetical protein